MSSFGVLARWGGGTTMGWRSSGGLVSEKKKRESMRGTHSLEREEEGVDVRSNGTKVSARCSQESDEERTPP